jgi:hypothetical protein
MLMPMALIAACSIQPTAEWDSTKSGTAAPVFHKA